MQFFEEYSKKQYGYSALQNRGNGRVKLVIFVTYLRQLDLKSENECETKVQTIRFYFMVFNCVYVLPFHRNSCFCVESAHFQLCKSKLMDDWHVLTTAQTFPFAWIIHTYNSSECLVLVLVFLCGDCFWSQRHTPPRGPENYPWL